MKEFTDISKTGGSYGRTDEQKFWHQFVGNLYKNKRILDVGAGLGLSKARLGVNGNSVTLQDVAPNLPIDLNCSIDHVLDDAFDVVTAFDVLEHVEKDTDFLTQLTRIAKENVVFTTPNYNISKNANPCHVREYTPEEIVELVKPYKVECYLIGNGKGDNAKLVKDIDVFLKHNQEHHGVILNVTT